MDKELKQEILLRVKLQPSILKKLSKRYNFDISFYRDAVSYNLYSFLYIPDEYKKDLEVTNIVLRKASTSYLDFPYNQLTIYNDEQKFLFNKINIILCFMNFYKLVYGKERKFEEEYLLSLISDENAIFTSIYSLLNLLDDYEREYIMCRYGLSDGKAKSISDTKEILNITTWKVLVMDNSSLEKIDKYINGSKDKEKIKRKKH